MTPYINGGGGYVGVHAAADTEYGWPYYGTLVGAWFASHQAIQSATQVIEDRAQLRSTIVTSQLPISLWHEAMGEPTVADAVLE